MTSRVSSTSQEWSALSCCVSWRSARISAKIILPRSRTCRTTLSIWSRESLSTSPSRMTRLIRRSLSTSTITLSAQSWRLCLCVKVRASISSAQSASWSKSIMTRSTFVLVAASWVSMSSWTSTLLKSFKSLSARTPWDASTRRWAWARVSKDTWSATTPPPAQPRPSVLSDHLACIIEYRACTSNSIFDKQSQAYSR